MGSLQNLEKYQLKLNRGSGGLAIPFSPVVVGEK
jgi:hypothetical protein